MDVESGGVSISRLHQILPLQASNSQSRPGLGLRPHKQAAEPQKAKEQAKKKEPVDRMMKLRNEHERDAQVHLVSQYLDGNTHVEWKTVWFRDLTVDHLKAVAYGVSGDPEIRMGKIKGAMITVVIDLIEPNVIHPDSTP